ncbi:hypothetical protein HPB52_001815 [Rhipicephalus sanguineus]|uniref:DM13 domain-containing protein n=1 Tax=Rhipicephalus sanguineus TaxID=34632 RepID=A0A9D4T6J5_RHISA|nr:hypothetical protein HPB52_001815 [Rhipicephalus sanguineus]
MKTRSPLLILGGFNVKHPDWGYSKAGGPGRRLSELAQDLNLSLLTDPTQPTMCAVTPPRTSASAAACATRAGPTRTSFAHVDITSNVDYPRPAIVAAHISGAHNTRADAIIVDDKRTLVLKNFHYDGSAPGR